MKKSHLIVALMIAITLGFIGTMGIHPASASDTARVYVYPAARPGPYVEGTVLTYEVRLDARADYGAPHENTEPAAGTDKTWAWEVVITYDPSVVHVTTDPIKVSGKDWFDFFHKWAWDAEFGEWIDDGPYSNFFAGTSDDTKGEVAATCTMTEDIPSMPIPLDDMEEPSFPQGPLHTGSYMDLPYSDGIYGSGLYAYDHFSLYRFRVTTQVDIPPGYTPLHISEASFFMYDKETKYSVDTEDATIGVPVEPEFPLGLGLMMAIAPAIPIVYIWRRRKWVGKK